MTELEQLKPLPSTTHCWKIQPELLENEDPRLREYVRITGAIGLDGEYCTQAHINAAVRLCKLADKARGGATLEVPSATIDLNLSPLHHLWIKGTYPDHTGNRYNVEVDFFRGRLELCQEWLSVANIAHETNVEVGFILVDCEVFRVKKGDDDEAKTYNQAIFSKYRDFNIIAQEAFPKARVQWYKYGGSDWRFSYSKPELALLGEGGFSINLYEIGDEERTWVMIRKLARRVDEYKATLMMPWVALGQSYDNDGKTPIKDDYPLALSYQLGVRLNNPHSGWPWNPNAPHKRYEKDVRIEVAFYTSPFRHKNFEKHFIAYVQGATRQPMAIRFEGFKPDLRMGMTPEATRKSAMITTNLAAKLWDYESDGEADDNP